MWNKKITLELLNTHPVQHLSAFMGIVFTEITENSLTATMPVNERTKQPFGILHGGASVVLAETMGSIASNLLIDLDKWIAVGQEVNANHLRPVSKGFVTAVCTSIHIGNKTHVWDIKIYNERKKMSCICRLTTAIISKPVGDY